MGIAAPRLAPEFHFSPVALGRVLMASPIGLLLGAFIGGRIADVWGRKSALVLAMLTFGAFQLVTAWSAGYWSLIVVRFLCGLGLGGAMPNFIALTSEVSGGSKSMVNVVIAAAGMPVGGAAASLTGFLAGPHGDWRLVFYIGGVAPLILAPIMALALPESKLFREARAAALETGTRQRVMEALFGRTHASATLLLWITFSFTTIVTHLMLNWLPVLMVAKGFSSTEAFLIQMAFNLGGAAGSAGLGWLMQRRLSGRLLFACYVGLAAALLTIASIGQQLSLAVASAAAVGAFVLGAQFTLYGLAPMYYRTETRGTGTGAAVAASRLGSVMGPFLAGQLLGAGATATHVLEALLPFTGFAAIAAVFLLLLKRQDL